MGRPGQGSNGRDKDVLNEVGDLVNRIEDLVKELREVIDEETGRQT